MKKVNLKRMLAAGLAAMTAVSAMSVSAFAAENFDAAGYAKMDNGVTVTYRDASGNLVQDSLYYVPEDAEKIEAGINTRASYPAWNWNNGAYAATLSSQSSWNTPYSFAPTTNGHLKIDSFIYGDAMTNPHVAINDVTDGSYIGSTYYLYVRDDEYKLVELLSNLNSSHRYRFTVMDTSNWDSAVFRLYHVDSY